MKLNNITLGSDPELFIFDSANNKIISSDGIIPGKKGDPYKPEELPSGYGLEVDNILAEFNIPPATNKKDFILSFEVMKKYIKEYVSKINPNFTILCKASAIIDDDQLDSDVARLFGCDPDFNIYLERQNPKPVATNTNLRTTGTHIHIGYDNKNTRTSLALVKYMDMFLGVPSILRDKDSQRRELYGKAGSFRLTKYGLEYRVLSGYFIKNTELIGWLYDQTMKAINAFENNVPLIDDEAMEDVINNNNIELAKELITKFNID